MSKIGRKPIDCGGVAIEIRGNEIHYKGKKASGVHMLPELLNITQDGTKLTIGAASKTSDTNRVWGLHRALLNNKIVGAEKGFEKQVRIVGLGFKAVLTGNKMQFSLGYSHKIDLVLPPEVTVEIDKTGQLLTFRSFDKEKLGHLCSTVKFFRLPEPYKGTGIMYADEQILRKAGKAKSS